MIRPPSDNLSATFARYLDGVPPASLSIPCNSATVDLPSFRVDTRRIVLVDGGSTPLAEIAKAVKDAGEGWLPVEEEVDEIIVAVAGVGAARAARTPIRRGVRAVSIHQAIAEMIGLPAGWQDRQADFLEQILKPIRSSGPDGVARLRLVTSEGTEDAANWLGREFRWGGQAAGQLLYIRAEAGKGKSTTLADLAESRLRANEGPIPLLVPLRELRRDAGVSWDAIALTAGVVGQSAQSLARAVRAGLVLLLLDGLDEVAGRYNPGVIQEVVQTVRDHTTSDDALVALSGRTTEGLLLGPDRAVQLGLELPAIDSADFRAYTASVVDTVVPTWPDVAARLPEPAIGDLPDRSFTPAERASLLDWIHVRFADVGKDRSLFFVQSLAGLGRTRQLDGNQPLYQKQPGTAPKVHSCPVSDACMVAASMACVREETKILAEHRPLFTAGRQLDVVTWFAVLASADAATRAGLPLPNALIADTFNLDPESQTDALAAISQQMQKHALLYATGGGGTAGDWQPAFLSEWVRAALLARAWAIRQRFPRATVVTVGRAVARAGRGGIAFTSIFPEQPPAELAALFPVLMAEADADSPEACANFWQLLQGLPDDRRAVVVGRPKRVVEMTDFSAAEFEGHDFGPEFSANLAVFVGTQFYDCSFRECVFTMCDFTGAEFVGCRFDRVRFENCDGPVRFDGCRGSGAAPGFLATRFDSVRSAVAPAWTFSDCSLGADCRFIQQGLARADAYAPVLRFDDCTHDGERDAILAGPELGQHSRRVVGLTLVGSEPAHDPAVDCLRRLLRTFFPSRVGSGSQPLARDYIRLSAVGRGAYPAGSPAAVDLIDLLEAEGFNAGGRVNHLFAPWSEVGGVTRPELRSEFSAFVSNPATCGITVTRMLDKIRKASGWPG